MYTIEDSFAKCSKCKLLGNPSCILDTNCTYLNEAEVVFVGENPGKVEVHRMLPFVGQSGIFLRKTMEKILLEHKWIITNAVQCSTIENNLTSNPMGETIEQCSINAMKLIEIANPKLVVLLGRSAVMGLLQPDKAIRRVKDIVGNFYHLKGICRYNKTFVTYHPRFVKDNSGVIKELYNGDFIKISNFLKMNSKLSTDIPLQTEVDFMKNYKISTYYRQLKIVD